MHGFEAYSGVLKTQSGVAYDARPKALQNDLREDRWSAPQITNLNDLMRTDPAEEIINWAVENFSPKLKFSCSFGLEDVVLLHLLLRQGVVGQLFFIDTGRHDQDTYDLIDRYRQMFGIQVEFFTPQTGKLDAILSKNGANQFQGDSVARGECCEVRKLEPLARALAGADAWLSGLRHSSAANEILEIDRLQGQILRINPLSHWTWQQLWGYVKANKLPYHRIYDQGYTAIDCAPCIPHTNARPRSEPSTDHWWSGTG